jgi:glycosyltransferase involved in cell wall biosynthesis
MIRSGDINNRINKPIKQPEQEGEVLRSRDLYRKQLWEGYQINARADRTWRNLENMGSFNPYNCIALGPFSNINNVWLNEPCFVVGTGPSLRGFDFKQLEGLHTIGINHVVEDYDGFEWLFALDDRFFKITSYDFTKFKGKIFSAHKCRLLPHNNNVRFKALGTSAKIPTRIEDGLWNGRMSGLAALNLAIITGANPIYLLGCDCGGGHFSDYHYKKDYTGVTRNETKRIKYVNNAGFFDKFMLWKDRVVNLSLESNIKTFKKMKFRDIPTEHKTKRKIKVIPREPIICHIQTMKTMEEMNDISQIVYNKTIGNHIYSNINCDTHPKADIYLLECYINGADRYKAFKRPYNDSKVISLIHSCSKCMPSDDSDEVVTITYTWKGVMQQKNIDSHMIYAGLNHDVYDLPKDYNKKSFGRITRYSRGKVHPESQRIYNEILDEIPESECHIISYNYPDVKRDRFNIYRDVKIHEEAKKAKYLQNINIFADAHFTFIETFSLCLLQAMASGCAIVLLRGQPAMEEVVEKSGYICAGLPEWKATIKSLLNDKAKMKEYGLKAKERSREFTIDRMVKRWNDLFKEVLKCK